MDTKDPSTPPSGDEKGIIQTRNLQPKDTKTSDIPPPMPREDFEYLMAFDREMFKKTGHHIIDLHAIDKIARYRLARGDGDGVEPVPETPAFVDYDAVANGVGN